MRTMNIWIEYPEQMAHRLRMRKALEKTLRERGVDIEKYLGTPGRFFVRGEIHLTLGGLMEIWRQCFPGEPIPEHHETPGG